MWRCMCLWGVGVFVCGVGGAPLHTALASPTYHQSPHHQSPHHQSIPPSIHPTINPSHHQPTAKALPGWTNVLSVGAQPQRAMSNPNINATAPTPGAPTPTDTPTRMHRVGSTKSNSSLGGSGGGGRASATGPLSLLSSRSEALWTSYKPSTRPNARVLVFLTDTTACAGTGRGAQINSTLLRKHFSTLTTAFLAPFAAYVTPVASEKLTPRGRGAAAAAAESMVGVGGRGVVGTGRGGRVVVGTGCGGYGVWWVEACWWWCLLLVHAILHLYIDACVCVSPPTVYEQNHPRWHLHTHTHTNPPRQHNSPPLVV